MQRKLMIYMAALALGLCGVAFLAVAAYEGLTTVMPSAFAALTTGGALLAFALSLVAIARRSGQAGTRTRGSSGGLDSAENALREQAEALLSAGVRRYPAGATVTTLLLGIVAGWCSESRDRTRGDGH